MPSTYKKLIYDTFILLIITVLCVGNKRSPCACRDVSNCDYLPKNDEVGKEVFVLTNGSSEYKEWHWDTVTTVVDEDKHNLDVMCYAHSQHKKYGIIIKLDDIAAFDDLSSNNTNVISWVEEFRIKARDTRADVVILDLMPLIPRLTKNEKDDRVQIDLFLAKLKQSFLSPPGKMDCIVPWKPVISGSDDSESVSSMLAKSCDRFMLSPDSYTYIEGYGCKARATIPITKLVLGVDEYVTAGITEERLIMAIPWHGYSYPCKSYNETTMVCKLHNKDNTSTCDVTNRERVPIDDVLRWKGIQVLHSGHWNNAYKAPCHVFKKNTSSGTTYHQLWYEDVESLRIKYQFAKDMNLKGIAIWTGDDLSKSKVDFVHDFNSEMWSWILHDLLGKGEILPRGHEKFYYANTVTGVALGCLFGGMLLGIVFTCIGFRQIKNKKKTPPFAKDLEVEDYHDDSFNL
ncbi:di-N-acetylchitobiase [Patella vulgata]|uniref:di-N-acetylchitobiase n=1 Tax=Patella vulgata TaxID=6465 RepID=UPI00218026F4|nr:di-N-acetylchitobiase [Patella vulgata]